MDKVSVLMSVYKETEQELKESIESILDQTYENFEFIIIIDYPDDKWRIDFIKKYEDNRIKIIVNEMNMGLVYSLNKGLKLATGKYIARMDADDISDNNRLMVQKKYLENNQVDLCGADFISFFGKNDIKKFHFPQKNVNIRKMLMYTNCVGHPTWFGKKEVFDRLEGYRNIFACEDYDFLLRAKDAEYKLANVSQFLLRYRYNEKSISRKNSIEQELIADFLRKNNKRKRRLSIEEIDNYRNSEKFKKESEKIEKYLKLKNQRNIIGKKSIVKYLSIYVKLILNIKYFTRDLKKLIVCKFITYIDKYQ